MAGRLKCSKCEAAATHVPRLSLTAFKGGTPHILIVWLPVCRSHWLTIDEVLGDEGWSQVLAVLVASKSLAPKRELTTLKMISIGGAEARQFEQRRRESMKFKTPTVH